MLDLPFATASDLVRCHARTRPAHPALVVDDEKGLRSVDYRTLDERMDAVAARLQREGLRPGGPVALCAPNSIDLAIVFLAAVRAGGVAVPLSTSATAESIERMRADAGADRVLAAGGLAELVAAPAATPEAVAIEPDAPFNIIYSSGTTGEPKGIVQPHSMRWTHLQRRPVYGYDDKTVTLMVATAPVRSTATNSNSRIPTG